MDRNRRRFCSAPGAFRQALFPEGEGFGASVLQSPGRQAMNFVVKASQSAFTFKDGDQMKYPTVSMPPLLRSRSVMMKRMSNSSLPG